MAASSSRNSVDEPIETIIDPSQSLIQLPTSFNKIWARANNRYSQTKISMSGKTCEVVISISDETVLFYAYKVAACFGFTEPTKVLLTYIPDINIFSMQVVEDPETEQSATGPELTNITSSDDENDSQEIVQYEEKTTEQNEIIRIVTWSKRISTAMARANSRQSLHFPTFVSTRFLQDIHKLNLQCPETGFSYKCELQSSKERDNNGFYLKRIGKGWIEFKIQHKLQPGDMLMFELTYYPYVLKVSIVRKEVKP